jgi:hypothetical protein
MSTAKAIAARCGLAKRASLRKLRGSSSRARPNRSRSEYFRLEGDDVLEDHMGRLHARRSEEARLAAR